MQWGSGSVSYLITIIREREGHASIGVFFFRFCPKEKIKKNFRKNLVVKKKRFTFASAFTTKATVL